jgi:hypothetical protein
MDPGSFIFIEGFSLQDAMSVLEVCVLCLRIYLLCLIHIAIPQR